MSDSVRPSTSNQNQNPIDWNLCILCQSASSEQLQCPANSNRKSRAGWTTLANNLNRLQKCNSLPFPLDLAILDKGNGLEASFRDNCAKWHKSCFLKCNNQAVERAEKKRKSLDDYGTSKKFTRTEVPATISQVCFLCDTVTKEELHNVETYSVDEKVRKSAFDLQDEKLIAKLSSGDLIALEAKYHLTCLSQLYRRRESVLKETEGQDEHTFHSLAFAELVEFVEEHRLASDQSPLRLADLTSLYATRLKQHGIEQRPHSTRLKNRLLGAIPDLQAHVSGKDVLLAFSHQVGKALESSYRDSSDDEALCLAKAARLIRRDIFNHKSQSFNGSMNQRESIPESLLALVTMVLTGPSITCNNKAKYQAALSIAQLMKFNCVKRSSPGTTTTHTKEQETPLPFYLGLKIHTQTRSRNLLDSFFHLGMSVSYDRVLQVSTQLTDAANSHFSEIEAVVPTNLRQGSII